MRTMYQETIAELSRQIEVIWKHINRLAGMETGPKINTVATGAPGSGDDSVDGYSVGSIWVNVSADDAYICCDASAGAAVWKKITP